MVNIEVVVVMEVGTHRSVQLGRLWFQFRCATKCGYMFFPCNYATHDGALIRACADTYIELRDYTG